MVPSGMDSTKASSAVMDDFVLKVYLPQLQEKVTESFLHAVNGSYISDSIRSELQQFAC